MIEYARGKPTAYISLPINLNKLKKAIQHYREIDHKKVEYGDLLLAGLGKVLQKFPAFNSRFDEKLREYDHITLGYFLNLGNGPLVATIEQAEKLPLLTISQRVKEIALEAIRGHTVEQGHPTFMVTNLFPFGAYSIHAPLFADQSCTLSIASPFTINGEETFLLTLSYDARAADCKQAADFLNALKKEVEQ